jgi:hypothetical protein
LAGLGEIGDDGAVHLADDGPERNLEEQILTVAPVLEIAAAVGAVAGASMWPALVVEQCGDSIGCLDYDVAAVASGPALWLAARPTLLALERGDTCTAVTGAEMDPYLVYKHGSPDRVRDSALAGALSPRR